MPSVAEALRSHREAAGLSQEALGRKAGVATMTISRLERGVVAPRLTTVAALASALDVTVADLVGSAS